jgi:hypothetical protein
MATIHPLDDVVVCVPGRSVETPVQRSKNFSV